MASTVRLLRPVRRVVDEEGTVVQLALEGLYVRRRGERGWLGPYPYGSLYLRCAEVSADRRRATRGRGARLANRGLLATARGRRHA